MSHRDRFMAKVRPSDDPDACWEWAAYRKADGYGMFRLDGQSRLAHRVAYELFVGPVPDGLQLDHKCRNRGCVNPAHLEPVTSRENTMRGDSDSAAKARATHCVNGHEFTPENTYVWPRDGTRHCRTCKRARDLRYERERRRRAAGEAA